MDATLQDRALGDPNRCLLLNERANSLVDKFMNSRTIVDLNQAIKYRREILTLATTQSDTLDFINNLATNLRLRFKELGQREDLNEAISLHQQALRLQPNRLPSLNNLATALMDRFYLTSDDHDLDHAIRCHRQALAARPIGHPRRSYSLTNLGDALTQLFALTQEAEAIEEAIDHLHEAVSLRPRGDPERAASLNCLGTALKVRFVHRGCVTDINKAVLYHEESLDLRPVSNLSRYSSLNNLANSLHSRYKHLGNQEDFGRVVALRKEVLDTTPPTHYRRPTFLTNLASILRERFDKLGEGRDLAEAITLYHKALKLCLPEQYQKATILNNLANAQMSGFHRFGRQEYLNDAVQYLEDSLSLRAPGDTELAMTLDNFAVTLQTRFRQQGTKPDLDRAIAYHSEALRLRPLGHSERGHSLTNTANTLLARFQYADSMDDLETCIQYFREALSLCPRGHPFRSSACNNFAHAKKVRFEQLQQKEDVETAIEYFEEAVRVCESESATSPGLFSAVNNLGCAKSSGLRVANLVQGGLDEVITLFRRSLTLCPSGSPELPIVIDNLAVALKSRYEDKKCLDDIDEAIEFFRQTHSLCPREHEDRASRCHNLAAALATRFRYDCTQSYLDEAMPLFRESVVCSAQHPDHSLHLENLAKFLLTQHDHKLDGKNDSCEEAFKLFKEAADDTYSTVAGRLSAVLAWASSARRRRHQSTLSAYSKALSLLSMSLFISPTVELQHESLSRAPQSLALDAASYAIQENRLELAVEILEQGRALLWSRMQGYRYSTEELRRLNKNLADRLNTVSDELDRIATSYLRSTFEPAMIAEHARGQDAEQKWKHYRILSTEWQSLVDQVRQLPGFEGFLKALPFSRLQAAALEGPIILVNHCEFRSDALIVLGDRSPVLVCLSQGDDWFRTVNRLQPLSRHPLQRSNREGGFYADFIGSSSVEKMLCSLWKLVVGPIMNMLRTLEIAEETRIWWCPTSKLCSLPLHAARPSQEGEGLPYYSSYIPTISSLIRARTSLVPCSRTDFKLLAIGQSKESLPCVRAEISKVVQRMGASARGLLDEEAKVAVVLEALPHYSLFHIACHGVLDRRQPFRSSFKLFDKNITILDFVQSQLPNAELAFLSACDSAAGDVYGAPDEVIHLAAAVQFCGFRSVVGTLWPMNDKDGPEIAFQFYDHLICDGVPSTINVRKSAIALHQTMKKMSKNLPLEQWVNFIHIGI